MIVPARRWHPRRVSAVLLAAVVAAAVAALVTSVTAAVAAPTKTSAGTALLRVDQVGYATTGAKHAYLMSSVAETGGRFALIDATGHKALTAAVGSSTGSWNATYGFVYDFDFSAVTTAGSYRVAVTGPASVRQNVTIAAPGTLYAGPLANALSFYQNQRDGADYLPSALRTAPAHLNDENAMTYLTPKTTSDGNFSGDLQPLGTRIDASGGWWDAGDYLKFVETTSYTVAVLLTGVDAFPAQFGSGYGAEARFGLDWLQRMWDDSTSTLYYQVGIGEGNAHIAGDHDVWRLPQADDNFHPSDPTYRYLRDRPVFRAGAPGASISPNLAGRLAADFALCYLNLRASAPAYADQCLRSAEHVYDLADTTPGRLLTVVPYGFYPENEWRDDLELGATELYRALAVATPPSGLPHTDPSLYLTDAAHWAHAYIDGPNDGADTFNLYDVSGLAHYLLYRAIQSAGDPSGLAVTPAELLADLHAQLATALRLAAADPFGFGVRWASYDSSSHAFGLSVTASEYAALTGDHSYRAYAARWVGNQFGANAWGTSLVIGDGTTFPQCPQHQVANLVGSLDGSAPVLAGAVVEGTNAHATHGRLPGMRACPPNGGDPFATFNGHNAVYVDNVQSYSTVEPAIDLTASSPLAFAWLAAG